MAALPAGVNPAELPAGTPPPDVQSNLVNPYSKGPVFLIFGPIITFFFLCFLAARIYAKAFILKSITADDYTCAFASVGTLGYFVICIIGLQGNVFGKHIWDVSLADISTDTFIKISYLTNWWPNPVWLAAKLTFYLLFLQIFKPNRILIGCIWAGIIVTTLFYVAVTIPQLYWSSPHVGQSFVDPLLDGQTMKTQALALPIAGFNLGSDIYIFALPLIGVRNLQMSWKKKIGVIFVFATGFAAVVTSLVALIYKVQVVRNPADYTWTTFPVIITNYTEMVVGISASCMPACSATLRAHAAWFAEVGSYLSRMTRGSGSKKGPSQGTIGATDPAQPYMNIDKGPGANPSTKGSYSTKSVDDIELQGLPGKHWNATASNETRFPPDRIHVTSEIHQSVEQRV